MIRELFPILSTPDLQRALAFYRDQLGGRVTYEFGGPDGRPAYVGLEIGSSSLGIAQADDDVGARAPCPISLWVYVDDCDEAVARLRRAGARVTQKPADQPWGERVARLADPDGNELIVGARADS